MWGTGASILIFHALKHPSTCGFSGFLQIHFQENLRFFPCTIPAPGRELDRAGHPAEHHPPDSSNGCSAQYIMIGTPCSRNPAPLVAKVRSTGRPIPPNQLLPTAPGSACGGMDLRVLSSTMSRAGRHEVFHGLLADDAIRRAYPDIGDVGQPLFSTQIFAIDTGPAHRLGSRPRRLEE